MEKHILLAYLSAQEKVFFKGVFLSPNRGFRGPRTTQPVKTDRPVLGSDTGAFAVFRFRITRRWHGKRRSGHLRSRPIDKLSHAPCHPGASIRGFRDGSAVLPWRKVRFEKHPEQRQLDSMFPSRLTKSTGPKGLLWYDISNDPLVLAGYVQHNICSILQYIEWQILHLRYLILEFKFIQQLLWHSGLSPALNLLEQLTPSIRRHRRRNCARTKSTGPSARSGWRKARSDGFQPTRDGLHLITSLLLVASCSYTSARLAQGTPRRRS